MNQEQVDASSVRVGQNRPDLQFTWNNQRYYVEFDTPDSPRGYPMPNGYAPTMRLVS